MSLLYAAYMLGAAMVGVPIVLHLLKRKPKKRNVFPSFMFLLRTAPQRQQKNNIRKWLVLAARCLIFLLLSLAFAWPFIPRFDKKPEVTTVLLWDNSFSMTARPYGKMLLNKTIDVIDSADMKHPLQVGVIGDRVQWSGEFEADALKLREFFERRPPAEGTSRFERALRQADLKLQRSPAPKRRIVLVTDRQLAPWQDVRMSQTLRPGTKLELMTPGEIALRNVAVQEARIDGRFTQADQALALRVVLKNYQLDPVEAELVTSIGGKTVDTRTVKLEAMGLESLALTLPALALEPALGRVRLLLKDDLALDNTAYFAINPVDPPVVGLVTSKRNPNAALFVELALNPSAKSKHVRTVRLDDESSLEDI